MHTADSEFRQLLKDIHDGSEEAARKLVDRYGSALLRVIRRRLDPNLRGRFDSIDFLQEALATFLSRPPAPDAFDSNEALFSFLANLARNKVVSAENSTNAPAQLQTQPTVPPAAGENTPQRNILSLLREGMSYREIALALGIHVNQVQRVVERIRSRVAS